jgi:hypothetical protein
MKQFFSIFITLSLLLSLASPNHLSSLVESSYELAEIDTADEKEEKIKKIHKAHFFMSLWSHAQNNFSYKTAKISQTHTLLLRPPILFV